MPTRSTEHLDSVTGHSEGFAACSHRRTRSADPIGLICALGVLVAALLLAATERSAQSAPAASAGASASLAASGIAPTDSLVGDESDSRSVTAEAVAIVDWDHSALGYSLEFHGPRVGLRALTFPYERRIEIYVRPTDTPGQLAHVIAHEIGHAIDVEHNSADERRAWLASRELDADYPWWPGSGLSDFATGAGDFAECFATWRTGSPSFSELPGECDVDLLQRLLADVP